jgi:hypothetical protein
MLLGHSTFDPTLKNNVMKKLLLGLCSLALLWSCSNDDDNTTTTAPNAGTITGGPFTFLVDGTPDMVSGISTDPNATGTNRSFVITDENGVILGLPPTMADLEAVDFDGAGAGVCLIWYLRFEDGLEGAAMGENAADLSGCFSLSNSITVTRTAP